MALPRPETEILVERAVAILKGLGNPNFFEAGIGTGCISISILKSCGRARAKQPLIFRDKPSI